MRKASCILLLMAMAAPAASADTLIMQGLQKSQASAAERPSRGMSMARVAAVWGEPEAKRAAVGDPPISRWEYGDFVVFFEYEHVVHSVARHP